MRREDKILKANFILNIVFAVLFIPVWYFLLRKVNDLGDKTTFVIVILGYNHVLPSIISISCHFKAYRNNEKFLFGGMSAHLLLFLVSGFLLSLSPEGVWFLQIKSFQFLFILVVIVQIVIPFVLLCFAEGIKKSGRLMLHLAVSVSIIAVGAFLSFLLYNSSIFNNSFVIANGVPITGKFYALAPALIAVIVCGILWEDK